MLFSQTSIRTILLIAMVGICLPAEAASSGAEPGLFQGHSDHRTFDIRYDDLNEILKLTVFDAGRSDRGYVAPPKPGIGRHFVRTNTSRTRLEGNRLNFPDFMHKDNLEALIQIRHELEALPGAVPMAEWTKNQQLAYWLNLYNVTTIIELAKRYPEKRLDDLLFGSDALLDQKLLTVTGQALSLNDIHHRILIPNWQDPLVIYGLFQGYVGSPNIRTAAYTADNVYAALKDNAEEFINSNRGARLDNATLEVSAYYAQNSELFTDSAALKAHLREFADASFSRKITAARWVEATTRDYYIADLFEGVRYDNNPNEGSSAVFADMGAGWQNYFDGKKSSTTPNSLPRHVVNYVMKIRKKKAKQQANVTVEEFEDAEGDQEVPQ